MSAIADESAAAAQLAEESGASGVLCADAQGLCLKAEGDAPADGAGFLRALSESARELGEGETPTVRVVTCSHDILIRDHSAALTVGLYREVQKQGAQA